MDTPARTSQKELSVNRRSSQTAMETITEESSRPVTPGEPTPMSPSAPSPSAVALRSPAGVGSRRRLVDPAASGRSNSSSKNDDSASDVTQRSLADNGKWSSKWSLQSVSKGTSGSLSPRMLAGGNGSGSVGGSERRPAGNAKEFVEAAQNGLLDVVQLTVEKGKLNVNTCKDRLGCTPLYRAAENGHVGVVEYLLDHGADLSRVDKNGWTALHKSAGNGHTPVVELLVSRGADVNKADTRKSTAFHVAAIKGYLGLAEYLVRHGANVNLTDYDGQTPLNRAAFWGQASLVACLQDHGADVNAADENGYTPLYWAAAKGHLEAAQLLADKGADVNRRNRGGATPLHAAATHGHGDVVDYLLAHGADWATRNKDGKHCFELMSAQAKLTALSKMPLPQAALEASQHLLWFTVIQEDGAGCDPALFTELAAKVEARVSTCPALATAKDANGRVAVDVASKPMKEIVQSVLLWYGRYRLTESRPRHFSDSSYVFPAADERTVDADTGQPAKVALKLMRSKAQFERELTVRKRGLHSDYVVGVLHAHPRLGSAALGARPDLVDAAGTEEEVTGTLAKEHAERLFLLVLPLADTTLWVTLKQERWAGQNMHEVRHVFTQLVRCVEHLHDRGTLHGDIKWKLIDLDSACAIGTEPVGHKCSSAYVPPEAVHVDDSTAAVCVRAPPAPGVARAPAAAGADDASGCVPEWDLLTAHPSFDVWSLGCVLYNMCTMDVRPLFVAGVDDHLSDDPGEDDNLYVLADWSATRKQKKLHRVADPLACNLLAQMLQKDPLQRPSLARVLAHPFMSGKRVARLVGDPPVYDVFLSYRVATDASHCEALYDLLTARGLKVFWDKKCLEPGTDWEEGFVGGLVSCRAFVPLYSRTGINSPDDKGKNWSLLTEDAPCDNVYLEQRFAVELHDLGMVEKIHPVLIGDYVADTEAYTDYFVDGGHPAPLPTVCVRAVEEKLRSHMESQALGTPLEPDRPVASVVAAVMACQGASIKGPHDEAFAAAADGIAKMLREADTDAMISQRTPFSSVVGGNDPHGHEISRTDSVRRTSDAPPGATINRAPSPGGGNSVNSPRRGTNAGNLVSLLEQERETAKALVNENRLLTAENIQLKDKLARLTGVVGAMGDSPADAAALMPRLEAIVSERLSPIKLRSTSQKGNSFNDDASAGSGTVSGKGSGGYSGAHTRSPRSPR